MQENSALRMAQISPKEFAQVGTIIFIFRDSRYAHSPRRTMESYGLP